MSGDDKEPLVGSPITMYESRRRAISPTSWLSFRFFSRTSSVDENCDEHKFPMKFPSIRELSQNEIIKINSNNLSSIPDRELEKLKKVKELRLTRNIYKPGEGLKHIPLSLAQLSTLEILDLRGNPLQTVTTAISSLSNLRDLILENCQISEIPSHMTKLVNLNRLVLDNNQIKDPSFSNLHSVTYLSLVNNGIIDISKIEPLNLTMLDLSENFVEELPEIIFNDSLKLEKLYLRSNLLQRLPASITRIRNLKILDISKNELRKLPEDIGKLTSLIFFNISYNELTALPKSIISLRKLSTGNLFCGENPLQKPPIEVCLKGPKTIESYFKALDTGPEIANRRLKLMVLGEARAGKTTLAKAIVNYIEPEPEENLETIGMDFFNWKVPSSSHDTDTLEVLIVDCAGQKRYLLTHQLFVATGMLFMVVVNLHTYKLTELGYMEKVGYWINLIIARIPKAVILIVPTHLDMVSDPAEIHTKCEHIITWASKHIFERKDEMQRDPSTMRQHTSSDSVLPKSYKLEMDGRNKTYNVINDEEPYKIHLIPVSNKGHLPGLKLLREEIIAITNNVKLCPNVSRCVPESWANLERLCSEERSKRKHPVISLDEIQQKATCFHSRKDIQEALQYIDSVGPIMYFHTIKNVSDVVFLDPKWLLELLKLIFRHDPEKAFLYKYHYADDFGLFEREFKLAKKFLLQSALLSKTFLRCIWSEYITDEELFDHVIGLLQKFDLAYDVELSSIASDQKNLLVPWFLKDECPITFDEPSIEDKVRIVSLVETRGVLPDGFFQRFIIKIYSLNVFKDCTPWNHGFKGLNENGEFRCKHERSHTSSCITLQGISQNDNKYHLWITIIPILNVLEKFIEEWKGISYRLFSVCPRCFVSKDYDYNDVPGMWKLDLSKVHCGEDMLSCHSETKEIDKYLIFPPSGMLINFLPEYEEKNHKTKNLQGELTDEEKNEISGKIGHRSEELRRALNVHEGQLESLHRSDVRERVYKIIQLWEGKCQVAATRKLFITALHQMYPYPQEIVDVVLRQ